MVFERKSTRLFPLYFSPIFEIFLKAMFFSLILESGQDSLSISPSAQHAPEFSMNFKLKSKVSLFHFRQKHSSLNHSVEQTSLPHPPLLQKLPFRIPEGLTLSFPTNE